MKTKRIIVRDVSASTYRDRVARIKCEHTLVYDKELIVAYFEDVTTLMRGSHVYYILQLHGVNEYQTLSQGPMEYPNHTSTDIPEVTMPTPSDPEYFNKIEQLLESAHATTSQT